MSYDDEMMRRRNTLAMSIIKDISSNIDKIPDHLLYSIHKMLDDHLYSKEIVAFDKLCELFEGSVVYAGFVAALKDKSNYDLDLYLDKDKGYFNRKIEFIKLARAFFDGLKIECGLFDAKKLIEFYVDKFYLNK